MIESKADKRLKDALKPMHDEIKTKGHCEMASEHLANLRSGDLNRLYDDIETFAFRKTIQLSK